MTHYYSNRPDFEKGDNTGWGYSNIDCVRNLLTDISEVAAKVKSEGLSDLYVQTGDASLGKDMPETTFVNAEHRALDMLESSKKVHAQVMQNIDGKFVQGIDDSLDSLNQVNEGDNAYTTDHLTYTVTETQSTYTSTGYGTPTYTVKKHYTISEIINHADSPIPAAQALYQGRLALAQEHLAALEAKDKETYERLSGLSDDALVENFFPTQLGKYERLRSTWKEDNKDWLQWVEIGGQVLAAAAMITGSLVSGGVLAPVLIGVGTTALAGNGFYQATSGESLSGRVLSTEERIWSGVEGVTTLATGGFATYAGVLARTGRTASTTVQAMTRATNLVDDVVDVTETLYRMKEDPLLALGGFALGRGVNAATNHIVSKRMAKAAAGGVSGIDLPSRSTRPDVELSSSLSSGKLAIDKSALPDVEVRSSDVPKVSTDRLTSSTATAEITANRVSGTGVKPVDVDVPKTKTAVDGIVSQSTGSAVTNVRSKVESTSFVDQMSPEDAQRYVQWNTYAEAGIGPSDRIRVLEMSEKAPRARVKDGLNQKDYFEKIVAIDKEVSPRPNPSRYLDSDYIEAHRQLFDDGAAKFQKFQPSEGFRNGIVGGKDGSSFWLSKEHADIIEDVAEGDNRLYETLLGFDKGDLGDGPLYRLDVSPEIVKEKGISIPSGNEDGANDWWRPGGRTYPGDVPEGVMTNISTKEGDHTWNIVN